MKTSQKKIVIIRDGPSDFVVLKRLVQTIFQHHNDIELGDDNFFEAHQTAVNDIEKFYTKADRSKNYHLFGGEAQQLKKRVVSILYASWIEYQRQNTSPLTNRDVIIVNSDAEKMLGNNSNYFQEWAYCINNIVWIAAEEFCEKMLGQHFSHENLPLILPLVLFPSSEILVASCMYDFQKEQVRSWKPNPDLKQKVYETSSISQAAQTGKLQEVVETYIVPESLDGIYKQLPEARKFMHILSYS